MGGRGGDMRMLETTVTAIHPRWPEAQREGIQGMKSAGMAVHFVSLGEKRTTVWLGILYTLYFIWGNDKKKKKTAFTT